MFQRLLLLHCPVLSWCCVVSHAHAALRPAPPPLLLHAAGYADTHQVAACAPLPATPCLQRTCPHWGSQAGAPVAEPPSPLLLLLLNLLAPNNQHRTLTAAGACSARIHPATYALRSRLWPPDYTAPDRHTAAARQERCWRVRARLVWAVIWPGYAVKWLPAASSTTTAAPLLQRMPSL